jgi:23S rRNA pseudouridine1911/1915/1917 synthase
MRLDKSVLTILSGINRSSVQRLIKSGYVKVNGSIVKLPGKKISGSDKVQVKPKRAKKPANLNIKVLYEDEDCIVLDKPAGVLTHSKGAELMEPTVASWLAGYLGKRPKTNRDHIVHRLDRGTSGVIICAKNGKAHKFLQKQFSSRSAKKHYTAIVIGIPEPGEAIIDAPISRNPKKPSRFKASENGKPAATRYKVVKKLENKYSRAVVDLFPRTGRTHQLRVHMGYINHPILGDKLYGGRPSDRVYLHAASLEIKLPSGTTQKFVSSVPKSFDNIN